MTTTMEDVAIAASHETRLDRGEVLARPRPHWVVGGQVAVAWVMNQVTDGIVWVAVLAGASGLGLLLEAIYDTVRYGHPR